MWLVQMWQEGKNGEPSKWIRAMVGKNHCFHDKSEAQREMDRVKSDLTQHRMIEVTIYVQLQDVD